MSEEATVADVAANVTESSQQQPVRPWARAMSRGWPAGLTLACYLLVAIFVTGRLWVDPAGRWQIGDVQDVNQATWFMRYTATAVEHFHLPALVTSAMNAPHSVNLMWNTSLLLPGVIAAPVTLLFGPQVSLTLLLVVGFAGSAASMFYVLRRWGASMVAASLGGAMFGFSPALVNSGIGHYSLVLAIIPPLMLDRLLRIITGKGSPVRNGVWMGLLAAAQLFVSEEALVDTGIAAVIILIVLAASRPQEVLPRLKSSLIGVGIAAGVALVLCARGLWVQFHGVAVKGAAATVVIQYNGRQTNLGTLPYAFFTPAQSVLVHFKGTALEAARYPQPTPEYLAYLGVPMIILLLVAIVYCWGNLTIRVAGITCVVLEWFGMGAKPIISGLVTLPGFLLPWTYLQHLPVIGGMVPDRLCILADAAAAVVLAFAFDLARKAEGPFVKWQGASGLVIGGVALALLPLVPSQYVVEPVLPVPAGWQATFAALHLKSGARVMLAPFPWSGTSVMLRWQAATGEPATMNGGDFIAPDEPGNTSRAGRAGLTPTAIYLDLLYDLSPVSTANSPGSGQGSPPTPAELQAAKPSAAQIRADLAIYNPAAVVAVTSPSTQMGQFLIHIFGRPTTRIGQILAWKL